MVMNKWLPFVSYGLMSEFMPPVGQEVFHCDMQRGFKRVRKKEPQVAALLKVDSTPQQIGLLAQKGVYEFYLNPELLSIEDGAEQVANILNLADELPVVQERVIRVLHNYHDNPILQGKTIIKLIRGDEGFPEGIELEYRKYHLKLFAAIDCIFEESDGTLHILDFKTGKSNFDMRQAYIYLIAVSLTYPGREAVASFYNLESNKWSERITISPSHISALQGELARIAQLHELEKQKFRNNSEGFAEIFPPNSGFPCKFCAFSSICEFSACEVLV